MKILVAYSSVSGNTKKVAEGLYRGLSILADTKQWEVDIINMKDNVDDATKIEELVKPYDTVICGFWIDKGTANREAIDFMAHIHQKNVGTFATLTADPTSEHGAHSLKSGTDHLLKDKSNKLLFSYICQGKLSFSHKVNALLRNDHHPHAINEERLQRWAQADTHPDENDIFRLVQCAVKYL